MKRYQREPLLLARFDDDDVDEDDHNFIDD